MGARAISPYYGFMVGWLIFLAYFVGVTPREVFQPGAGPVPASEVTERQPTD